MINTLINDTFNNIVKVIDDSHLPISIVKLMLQNILSQINEIERQELEREANDGNQD